MLPRHSRKRIACFHGGGSNAEIFEFQCRPLQHLLEEEIELVFFDAPFERNAGPGVLPWFVDFAPFKTWFTTTKNNKKDDHGGAGGQEISDGSGGYDEEGSRTQGGIARVLQMMEAHGGTDGGGEWVAAMGFSQGTRVVGGLLLHQQRQRQQQQRRLRGEAAGGGEDNSSGGGTPGSINFKFGVLCMGGGVPMQPDPPLHVPAPTDLDGGRLTNTNTDINGANEATALAPAPAATTTTDETHEKITIPTLHLHGLKDEYLPNSRRQLATSYDASAATLCEIEYHHAMPWNRADVQQVANLITKMCRDTARPTVEA